eukprot:GEMP01045032.1.p1 GENE.GEMP01045032.1~~GEMP01045032.1.p1  ORF type:complete len:455 (+),score=31.98 GEMP01045032.1:21-1385(+)
MVQSLLSRISLRCAPLEILYNVRVISTTQACYRQLPLPAFLPPGQKQDVERIAFLKHQVEEARKIRDGLLHRIFLPRVERMDCDGNLRCSKCGLFKPPDLFHIGTKALYGRNSHCKICSAELKRLYYSTLRGAMLKVFHNAKHRAVKRSKIPLREEAGRFELNFDFVLNLYWKQRGRCAYSDIVMNVESYTTWQLSLERRDNKLGYIPENVVFVCAEFNTADFSTYRKYGFDGSTSWSREKVNLLPKLVVASLPLCDDELAKIASPIGNVEKKKNSSGRKLAPNGDLICSKCNQLKTVTDFSLNPSGLAGRYSVCKECTSLYAYSFHHFFMSRLQSAKQSAKKRAAKNRINAGVFQLTIDDAIGMYTRQRGLCFYSGIRMVPKPGSQWMVSMERLDNARGYVRDNVVLICFEFQTSDRSGTATSPVKGSCQWSKEKIAMLLQWLRSTHACLRGG